MGALALAWRAGFFFRLHSSILFGSLEADSAVFWAWSGRILRGELVSREPFFFGPLYAYALALARAPSPSSVELVLVIQILLGTATVVLLTDTVRRLVSSRAALIVGVLLALNPMLVFFDSLSLMEGLLIFIQSLLLWIVISAGDRPPGGRRTILAGILIGLLSQGRPIYALLLVPLLIHLMRLPGTRRVRTAMALVASAAGIMSLSLIHNVRANGEWIPFTYSFGYNLYVGNHSNASGTFATITGTSDIRPVATGSELNLSDADGRAYLRAETGRSLTPRQSSAYWTARAFDWIRQHPGDATRALGKRVLMLWNRHEYPQIENADEYRMLCGPLGLPIAGSFGFLAILALIGVTAAWKGSETARWLVIHLALLTTGTALFFVTDRYRSQLIPATALLAGWGVERLLAGFRARRLPRGAWAGLVAGVALVFAPLPYLRGARYEWDLNGDLGSRWIDKDPARSIEFFSKAVALERGGRIVWHDTDEDRLQRALLYHDYARALRRTGDLAQAASYEGTAAALAPQSNVIRSTLRAMSSNGGASGGLTERAWAAARRGAFPVAESLFSASVATEPRQPDAWAALIRLRIQRGDTSGAGQALRQGAAFGLSGPSLLLHQALVSAAEGDEAKARELLNRVPPADASDPVLASVRQAIVRLTQRPH